MLAAKQDPEILRALLLGSKYKLKINQTDDYGKTALYKAIEGNNLPNVKILFEHHADLNVEDGYGVSSLVCAAIKGNYPIMKFLLENGVPLEATNRHHETALLQLAETNKIEPEERYSGIKFLVEQGAQINARDNEGNTALHFAAKRGDLALINYLINNKAALYCKNIDGDTPLHTAARHGQHEAVDLILNLMTDKQQNAQIRNKDRKTPAQCTRSLDVLNVLLNHGIPVAPEIVTDLLPIYRNNNLYHLPPSLLLSDNYFSLVKPFIATYGNQDSTPYQPVPAEFIEAVRYLNSIIPAEMELNFKFPQNTQPGHTHSTKFTPNSPKLMKIDYRDNELSLPKQNIDVHADLVIFPENTEMGHSLSVKTADGTSKVILIEPGNTLRNYLYLVLQDIYRCIGRLNPTIPHGNSKKLLGPILTLQNIYDSTQRKSIHLRHGLPPQLVSLWRFLEKSLQRWSAVHEIWYTEFLKTVPNKPFEDYFTD